MSIEAPQEARTLVMQVVLDLEVGTEARRCVLDAARAPELARERVLGEVGDVRHHRARDRRAR